ncbi:DUF2292 domain-containing protein [Candidatus Roizmanbacteria bacterium]|nr:DUF2292 domain-containing protein [Candidatus Roizmanbacteria bacterium]
MAIQQYPVESATSTRKVSNELLTEIKQALKNIRGWGSVEIYIQNYKVVQITERNIRKTGNGLNGQNGDSRKLTS